MSRIKLIVTIVTLLSIFLILSLLIFSDLVMSWFKFQWLDLLYAAIMAIIAGIIIEYFYRKYSYRSKFSKTTIVNKPRKLLAKLILPDNNEFIINEYERIFGREDFVGAIIVDDLLFLGKQHFKLTLMDDGFYIEDMDTKNGTMVNEEEIKGMGKIKLRNQDEILVAKVLKLKYLEQESYD